MPISAATKIYDVCVEQLKKLFKTIGETANQKLIVYRGK